MSDIRSFFGGKPKSTPSKKESSAKKESPPRKESPARKKKESAPPKVDPPEERKEEKKKSSRKTRFVTIDSDEDDFEKQEEERKLETPKKKETKPQEQEKKATRKKEEEEEVKAKRTPKKKGKKEEEPFNPLLPLHNINFALTGEFHDYSKDTLKDEIMRLGGKVTGAVSGRTSYLFAGHILDDGRETTTSKKYQTALEKGIKILVEDELKEFLAKQQAIVQSAKPAPSSSSSSRSSNSSSTSSPSRPAEAKVKQDMSGLLWVDKYKPKQVGDLVGNKSTIEALSLWLRTWEAVHIHHTKPKTFSKGNPTAAAALLSGPPGIGKTSAATIVARSVGYDVFELNASDARSKKIVAATLGDAVNSASLIGKTHKRVIIMDEVDGMSSDDRGGMQELIKLIKKTKVPIICICNDRQKSSVRSLANYCFDLKFSRPSADNIIKRVTQIAQMEGMTVEPNAIRELAIAAQGDVRQVIGTVQMWGRSTSDLSYDSVMKRKKEVNKDEQFQLSTFDACRFIFNESKKPEQLDHRYNAYFIDYDLIPLMIQDNYVNACKSGRDDGSLSVLERVSSAADAVCDADIASKCVRSGQNWSLLPQVAARNVMVTSICAGSVGFPSFPQWLSKNSSRGKKKRLVSETAMHMRQRAMVNPKTFRLEYFSTMKDVLLRPLLQGDKEKLSETIQLMDAYGIDRDDLFETMQEVRLGPVNIFDRIDSKTKAAFTREYNKASHTAQALVEKAGIVGLKRKRAKKTSDDGEEEDDAMQDEVEEEDDEAADVQALKELHAPKAKKARKSTASTSSSSGKGKKKRK